MTKQKCWNRTGNLRNLRVQLHTAVATPAAGLLLVFWQSAYVLGTALLMPSSGQVYYKNLADL